MTNMIDNIFIYDCNYPIYDKEIFKEGNFIENLSVETDEITGQFVKFTLESAGNCPDDHVRPGQPSKIYIDEVVIE